MILTRLWCVLNYNYCIHIDMRRNEKKKNNKYTELEMKRKKNMYSVATKKVKWVRIHTHTQRKARHYIKQKMKNGDRSTPSSEYEKKMHNSCNNKKNCTQSIFDVQEFSCCCCGCCYYIFSLCVWFVHRAASNDVFMFSGVNWMHN